MSDLNNQLDLMRALHDIVEAGLVEKEAQDPQTAGIVGDPVPAEVVQGGAQAMVPPPGAAVGVPEAQTSPEAEALAQIGTLLEQGLSAVIELLTRVADAIERQERQMILLTGQEMGANEAAAQAQQATAATPKAASVDIQPREGFYEPIGSDGIADTPLSSLTLRESISKTSAMFEAVQMVRSASDN